MDRLTEDQIYELASRVKGWEQHYEGFVKYQGRVGNLEVTMGHFVSRNGVPSQIDVHIQGRHGSSTATIGVIDSTDQRFIDLYQRIDTAYKHRVAQEKEQAALDGMEEAARLLRE